jgi:hypothetical protein
MEMGIERERAETLADRMKPALAKHQRIARRSHANKEQRIPA